MIANMNRRRLCAAAGASLALATTARTAWAVPAKNTTLRIGQSLPLTGPLAGIVKPVLEGQAALFDEINSKGGINGAKIELITRDDANDPKRVLANAAALIEQEQVVSLFGLANAAGVAASLPMLAERKVPLVGIYAGADLVRRHHPYFFTTTASFRDEVVQMVRTLTTVGSKRLAVACMTTNDFDKWMLPMVEQVAREHGATITVARGIHQAGGDAAEAAKAIADSSPNAVLLLAAGPCVPAFLKAARQVMGIPMYALSIAGGTTGLTAAEQARGLVVTQVVPFPWRQTSALNRQFSAAMERAGLPVSYDRMWGYLNATVLAEGLKRAGRSPTPAAIVTAMEGMSDVNLGGYRVGYSPDNHNGSRFVEITIVGSAGEFKR
ncbi:MAG: ABC transporter substrate-binding protein [Burkholderiales bacterium]|nr:ABC transporter substrate-binding protein [Burkholderiales bacterium]